MQELHSVIRRRKGDETGGKYLASRNKLKKTIKMTLRNLKGVKSESPVFPQKRCLLHAMCLNRSRRSHNEIIIIFVIVYFLHKGTTQAEQVVSNLKTDAAYKSGF